MERKPERTIIADPCHEALEQLGGVRHGPSRVPALLPEGRVDAHICV